MRPLRFGLRDRVGALLTRFPVFSPVWCAFDRTVVFLFATPATRRSNRGVGSLFGFVNNEQGWRPSQGRRSFFRLFACHAPAKAHSFQRQPAQVAGKQYGRHLVVSAPVFLKPRAFPYRPKIRRVVVFSSSAIIEVESILLPVVDQKKQGAKERGQNGSQGDGQYARLRASSRAMRATFEFQLRHASWDVFARQVIYWVRQKCRSAPVRMGNRPR